MVKRSGADRIVLIGNFAPRRCGIATFTRDLSRALGMAGVAVDVVAMSDEPGYEYPPEVVFDIPEDDLDAYRKAAERLNDAGYRLACVQHEYGIFGGPAGRHLLTLLRELNMPVVTTLHTVLTHPTAEQRAVMDELISLSQRVVVMSDRARSILHQVHGADEDVVTTIPHGIPDLPDVDPETLKAEVGLAGKKVVATFGLLSPDKGIQYAIEALAQVPEAVYVVAGQTHPHIVRHSGEAYRESLVELARRLGVEDRLIFWNRFMDDQELGRLLRLCDVYVTPYLKEEQITSGTLAFSVGNGKAVVATPYWHAQELLADGRGILVPFRDSRALAEAIGSLLSDEAKRREIEKRAFEYGRRMRWPAVGQAYRECFEQTTGESVRLLGRLAHQAAPEKSSLQLPPVRLEHLVRLTDDTGILQHARYTIPRRAEGYCIDDNARALLLCAQLQAAGFYDPVLPRLTHRYLAFCEHAFNPETGRFRNFMSYDRRWLEDAGSEDSHGRSLWALGTAAGISTDPAVRALASELFEAGLPAVAGFTSPRAWAYTALGLVACHRAAEARPFVSHLLRGFEEYAESDWPWFEPVLAYANARLPQALVVAGHALRDEHAVEVGLRSLQWLTRLQRDGGRFSPVGCHGFYRKGGEMARFDQQPIEAAAQVSACLAALEVSGDPQWRREAERAFAWFLGHNVAGAPLADVETGGCRDGLHPEGANENQGAESTLSYLTALVELTRATVPIMAARVL